VPEHKKCATYYNECRGISLSLLTDTILSVIFLLSLTPHIGTATENDAGIDGENNLKRYSELGEY
jgi:hypothetical protein